MSIFLLIICLTNCSAGMTIPDSSKEFNQDIFKLLNEIDKDIKNKTNETSICVPGSLGYEFLQKYQEKKLTNNEEEVLDIIKSALKWRTGNFMFTESEPLDKSKYSEVLDEYCIEELEKIKDIK